MPRKCKYFSKMDQKKKHFFALGCLNKPDKWIPKSPLNPWVNQGVGVCMNELF